MKESGGGSGHYGLVQRDVGRMVMRALSQSRQCVDGGGLVDAGCSQHNSISDAS